MPYELFIALRFLRGRRGATRVTALAALLGVACGVGALIFALALANGFREELRDKILRGTAHVTLTRVGVSPAEAEWRGTVARLRRVGGVADASATTYAGALLSGPEGAAYTVLRGVDPESTRAKAELRRSLTLGAVENLFTGQVESGGARLRHGVAHELTPADEGDEAEEETPLPVIVGAELARRTGLDGVGDEGLLITGEQSASDRREFVTRERRVRVVGLFRSGLYDYDAAWSYAPLADSLSLAGAAQGAPVISVEAADIYATNEVATSARREAGPGWAVVDWREANRPLFAALELERRTVAVIIALIVLVAALNITATLVLVVFERRTEIATLGALGATPRGVSLIFLIEGALVGAVGAALGVALGLAACYVCERFGLVRLPPDVYSLSAVPLRPRPVEVALAALAAFGISLLATLYPARAAARVRPAEALRYE